jgi:pimeloyl-ACP methyl ester carboxylesterase
MGSTPAAAYLACQDAVDAFDVAARLPEIASPTLVVHSDQDVVPLADKQQLAAGIPRARLATIERSRHVLLWDRPDALNELLLAFLAGH